VNVGRWHHASGGWMIRSMLVVGPPLVGVPRRGDQRRPYSPLLFGGSPGEPIVDGRTQAAVGRAFDMDAGEFHSVESA
jgi:hypothetical protein